MLVQHSKLLANNTTSVSLLRIGTKALMFELSQEGHYR